MQANTYFGDISDIFQSRFGFEDFWLQIKFLFSFIKLEYSYKDSTTGAVDRIKFQTLKSDFFPIKERFVTEFVRLQVKLSFKICKNG